MVLLSKKGRTVHSNIKKNKIFNPSYSSDERTRAYLKVQDGCDYTCSFCTIPLARGKSEIELAELDTIDSKMVKPKSLKTSPINMECKLFKIVDLPIIKKEEYNGIMIGHVIGVNINDKYIKNGIIDINKLKPLARLGYMDYSVVDNFFKMNRPE